MLTIADVPAGIPIIENSGRVHQDWNEQVSQEQDVLDGRK
jgi:hypothetical protein